MTFVAGVEKEEALGGGAVARWCRAAHDVETSVPPRFHGLFPGQGTSQSFRPPEPA
jgi:hypothetical protein